MMWHYVRTGVWGWAARREFQRKLKNQLRGGLLYILYVHGVHVPVGLSKKEKKKEMTVREIVWTNDEVNALSRESSGRPG